MKKAWECVFVFSMILILAACGSKKTSSGDSVAVSTSEVVTSSEFAPSLDTEKEVVLNIQGNWDNFEALDAIESAFNKYYPNVHISYQKLSDYKATIENLCPTGELDLVFHTSTASAWADGNTRELYIEYMKDLGDTDIDLSGINPNALACGQLNGKQYGVHVYEDFFGLLVNNDLLSKNGFDVPASYEELVTICEAFAQKPEDERAVLSYGKEQGRTFTALVFANIIRSADRDSLVASINAAENVPELVFEGIPEKYATWTEKGYFNSANSTIANSYNAAILEFFNGKAPFLQCNAGTYSGCKKREASGVSSYSEHPFAYSFIPMPNGTKDDSVILTSPTGMFSVCKTSKNVDYAVEFLKFLVRTENMATLSTIKGMPSTDISAKNPKFEVYSTYDSSRVYSTSSIGLSGKAFKKLKEATDCLMKENPTAEMYINLYREKMGK